MSSSTIILHEIDSILSIIVPAAVALVVLILLVLPGGFYTGFSVWLNKLFGKRKTLGEIVRFLIVGGLATLLDMFVMGVVMYAIQPEIYATFLNVFVFTPEPSTLATIAGTAVGFLAGLVFNYVLSILFVFNEKGESRSTKGFVIFAVLSTIGLGINMLGMYVGFDLLGLNQWLVKIIMVLIVLVYNYISKRLLLFRKPKTNS